MKTIEIDKPRAGALRRETGKRGVGGVGCSVAGCGDAAIGTGVPPPPKAGATRMTEAS